MFAMHVKTLGDSLKIVDIPTPQPAPNEIQIRVSAVGMNFADLLISQGQYQIKPPLPFSPGMEVCGVISALGEEINDRQIGTRVAGIANFGGLAEYICLPHGQCLDVPDKMSDEIAAGFIIAYGTSYLALVKRAKLQAQDNLLVLGASGGVGRTAVEIGRVIGAKVIAAASSDNKLKEAKIAGADHLIHSLQDDLRSKVKALGGADVVYDPVGGSLFNSAMRSMNPEGRIIPIGFASGDIPSIPANILLVKNLDVIGCYWGGYLTFNPKVIRQCLSELFIWFEQGLIAPHISSSFPLKEANEALQLMATRQAVGKIVIKIM